MPPRRRKLTPEEALEQFARRAERTSYAPSIYRWEPMEQQKPFLLAQEKHRMVMGGNRSGKTAITTYDDALIICHKHPYRQHMYPDGPIKMRLIGADFERNVDQTLVPYIQQYLPPSVLINGSWEDSYRPSEHILTLADESVISFMSYEQDPNKFQSVDLDHIHFDEEPPEPIFKESRMRLVDRGGTMTISETPVTQLEWLQDEILEPWQAGALPNWNVFHLKSLDNIHLSQEDLVELLGEMTEEEKLIRLHGMYPPGKSRVFPEFTGKAPFIIPHQEFLEHFRRDPGPWSIYESMDHGYVNPTAWIWTAVHQDGSIVTFHVRYAPGIIVREWASIVLLTRRNLARQLGLSDGEFASKLRGTFGDPAIARGANGVSGTTIQQEYGAAGVYIGTEGLYEARAGNNNVGLDHMHKYLRTRPLAAGPAASNGLLEQPWWQITDAGDAWDHAQNEALAGEMRKARTPKQTLKQQEVKNPAEQIRDKDNHAIDGQKYLFMITHELRPYRFVEQVSDFARTFTENIGRPVPFDTGVADDFDGNVPLTLWDTYSSLEQ